MTKNSSLKDTFQITNSLLGIIALTLLLAVIYDHLYIWGLGALGLLILIPSKIYLYSGMYGQIASITSGETITMTFKDFHNDAKRFWPMYLLLSSLPFFIFSILSFFFSSMTWINASSIAAITNIAILGLFSMYVVSRKYIHPLNLKKHKNPIQLWDVINIISLYTLDLLLFFTPQINNLENLNLAFLISSGRILINFLLFTYITITMLKNFPEIREKFHQDNEIYLINPINAGAINSIAFPLVKTYPPIFVILKALTPKKYTFREFNRVHWNNRYYTNGKLVCITSYTSNCQEAYKLAKEFKKKGSTVIMGGPHATYVSDEALDYCDSVVMGEVESIWKEVIDDYENNTLKKTYLGQALENHNEEIHQELLNSPPNVIKDFLETSRGCKFKCHFCTVPGLTSGSVRNKPIPKLIELISKVQTKYNHITFIDNNIYNDPAYAKELFKALKPLDIKWGSQSTIDLAKNDAVLNLAKESGCEFLLFGYEIFGDSQETKQKGKFSLAKQYLNYSKKVKKLGIDIKAQFIFGFDSDNFAKIFQLWGFCFRLMPYYMGISFLTPIPGSGLYQQMLNENRITNLNWENYTFGRSVSKNERLNQTLNWLFFPIIRILIIMTSSICGILVTILIVSCVLIANIL